MKALLLNPHKGFELVEANGLNDYYKYLECDCIDITTAMVNGNVVNIIVDDEGLMKENPVLSAFYVDENETEWEGALAGNLLFCGEADEEGELTDISKKTAMYLLTRVRSRVTYDEENGHELIWHVLLNYY